MSNYYPPPPGLGGASHNSLPPRPPPSGPSGNGGGRDSYRGGRFRNGRMRGRDRDSNGGGGGGGGFNPPRGDFTFRADKPAGVQEAQQRGDHYVPGDRDRDRDRDRNRGRDRDRDRDWDRDRDHGRDRDWDRRGGAPPSGPRSQNGSGRRGGARGRGRDGRGGGRFRGRGGGGDYSFGNLRFLAANRPILTQTSQPAAGGPVQNFVKDNEGTTYLDLDDLSDSDEAEMDISGGEGEGDGRGRGDGNGGYNVGDDTAADDDDDKAPPKKRARLSNAAPAVPRWSNPDPYTVLPPTETNGAKKKDVVHLIRKARVKAERAAAKTSADTEEFISCGLDSSDEEGGEEAEEDEEAEEGEEAEDGEDGDDSKDGKRDASGPEGDDADGEGATGSRRRDQIGRHDASTNDVSFDRNKESSNRDSTHNNGNIGNNSNNSNNAAPTNAPSGPRGLPAAPGTPSSLPPRPVTLPSSSLAAELNTSRKRTHDDQLKPLVLPDHAALKPVTKMPVNGIVTPEWRVRAREPACPWMLEDAQGRYHTTRAADATTSSGVWLHKEICDFYDFVKPRRFEQRLRQDLLEDLQRRVRKRFSNGHIRCFGSYMSGLYLPLGDMDLVMCSTQYLHDRPPVFAKRNHLYKFGHFLCQADLAEPAHLEHITRAKVPLVKYIDRRTGLKVDVSFENLTGVAANDTFTAWKAQFPAMPVLVTLVKQFLAMRGLNEPVNGGIGGFSIICLVVSMLQLLPPVQSGDMDPQNHLGELLMRFFDLYGNKFNYEANAICLNPPGYIAKSKVRNFTYKNPDRLSIIDPNNPENDISGGSKNTPAIMRAFSDAYDALQKRMVDLAKLPVEERPNHSILAVILQGDYSSYRTQREYLRELYVREYRQDPED